MKKLLATLFLAGFVLIATQTHPDLNPTTGCTGGACFVDSIRSNTLFENQNIFAPQGNYSPQHSEYKPVTTDGLSNTPYTYDQNCQFGNCLNSPAGSFSP